MDGELRATRCPVLYHYGCAMQFDDALHDRKPKPRASLPAAIATPKAAKDKIVIPLGYARTSISHPYCPAFFNDKLNGRTGRSMLDGILCEITDCTLHHLGVALDPYGLADAKQGDLSYLLQCQGHDELNRLAHPRVLADRSSTHPTRQCRATDRQSG